MNRLVLPVTILATLSTSALSAQSPQPVAEGDRVRVRVHEGGKRLYGRLVELDRHRLSLRPESDTSRVLFVGLRGIESLEVATDQPDVSAGILRGAGMAVGITLLGGVFLQVIPTAGHDPKLAFAAAILLSPVAALVGAVVGANSPPPVWQPVPLPDATGDEDPPAGPPG